MPFSGSADFITRGRTSSVVSALAANFEAGEPVQSIKDITMNFHLETRGRTLATWEHRGTVIARGLAEIPGLGTAVGLSEMLSRLVRTCHRRGMHDAPARLSPPQPPLSSLKCSTTPCSQSRVSSPKPSVNIGTAVLHSERGLRDLGSRRAGCSPCAPGG
jgi:hypothetical protein